jgi:cysteine desulfurase/selenocysteine lyase
MSYLQTRLLFHMVLKPKDEFPLCQKYIYFDCAAQGAMPLSTIKTIEEYERDLKALYMGETPWSELLSKWTERRMNSKKLFSELFGCGSDEVAFVSNATNGLNTAFRMIPVKRGQNIVTTDMEFPMCNILVNAQRRRGAEPRFIKNQNGVTTVEDFRKAVDDKTAVVMVDSPTWYNGYIHDLKGLSELAHDHGAKLIVDATQGVGSLDWEAKKWGVDFAAISTYKWVMGGPYSQSAGFMYASKEILDEYQPPVIGASAYETKAQPALEGKNYFTYKIKSKKGIGRFEVYNRAEVAYVAVENSMRLLLSYGKKAIERQVKDVDNAVYDAAEEAGYKIGTPADESKRMYLSLKVEDPENVSKKLYEHGCIASYRVGGLRVAPHFYNTVEEAEKFIKILKQVAPP